ncbi:hypothetical protein GCM10007147_05690 [Nocardiopsis kunsanensis]|uniref:Uncharacterized protein n=1 Tax=Nocardiopsis kunsanensis TaxID=141693 RepID=A0A918X8X9_9ACTN|nr:hypothetical protein GCM10007147_05690 [Nocardiopsis kunsanensis]
MNHGSVTPPAEAPSPEQISDYLHSRGWHREPESWRGSQVWTWPEVPDEQILLPPRLEYRDDNELVLQALYALARFEGRDLHGLFRAISRPWVDTQYFHTHPPSPSGTVPLLSGINALEGVRGAFTSAAQAVLDHRFRSGRGRNSKDVDAFLRCVRLGPSTAGSYILSAEVPLTPPRTDQLFPEPPQERRVVRAMHRAVSAAQEATAATEEAEERMDAFDEAMGSGVSSRLCESLAQFGGHGHDQKFSIRFAWSPSHPEESARADDHFSFGPRAARILQRAGARLRELEHAGTVRMSGQVVGAERHSPSHDGFVKVQGTLSTGEGARERTLLVRLRSEHYEAALIAHSNGDFFEAEGRLSTGNRRELVPHQVLIAGRLLQDPA